MHLRTLLFPFAALIVTLAVAGGCERSEGTVPSREAANAPPEQVRLGYFANLTHAQAVLGVASGEFEKAVAPAKFSTKVFNAGPSLIEALFAGEIDIGYIGPGPGAQRAREEPRPRRPRRSPARRPTAC